MSQDNEVSNKSGNRPFAKILETAVSRRDMMKGSLAAALSGFMSPLALNATTKKHVKSESLIGFEAVPVAQGKGPMPAISADYEYQTLIPWGTPLKSSVQAYNGEPDRRPTAEEQAAMIGIGHDGMCFFPETARGRLSNNSGLLCINHEFGRNSHVLGKSAPGDINDVRLSQHAHGVSVVAIENTGNGWKSLVDSKYNRRIHVNTDVEFSGPVVDSDEGKALLDLVSRPDDAKGTVNNCSSGYTPWGTYLTCEENFNGYFGSTGGWVATEAQQRYGFSDGGFGYGWENFDERFDLANTNYKNEDNRFGWVVEINPFDPDSRPVKRTALGRFKHEGATLAVGRGGRAVVYMGDDQRFDYIYKFVSADNYKSMLARGVSPLDEGKLYAAKFNDDGTGEWLELTINNPMLAEKFTSQAEVLTYARLSADILGATPMDRPEWTTVAPDEYVYCTLTNNSRRSADDTNAANPLGPNADGHIIRWKDTKGFTGDRFEWEIYVIAETTHGSEQSFSDPDGIWADPDGRIFIQTDGGQKDGLNNQMLVADAKDSNSIKRLFTGVSGDEITGLTVTPNRQTMFINTQHPGNGNPGLTNFPAKPDGVTIPRDCTIVIRRKDGGIIGS